MLAVRDVSEERIVPQFKGNSSIQVKGARVVERFVITKDEGITYQLTGVLVKVKCAGGKSNSFNVHAEFMEDHWKIHYPEGLELDDDEELISKDYMEYELHLIKKMRLE